MGQLFSTGGLKEEYLSMFGKNAFSDITSVSGLGDYQSRFNQLLGVNEKGVSKYTMAQIKAKTAMMGFNDQLALQATGLGKDADLYAKARLENLTYGDALKGNKATLKELGKALEESDGVLDDSQRMALADVADDAAKYNDEVEGLIKNNKNIANSLIVTEEAAEKATKSTSMFSGAKNLGRGMLAMAKSILPYVAAIGAVAGAFYLYDKAHTKFTQANDKATESVTKYQESQSELDSLNEELKTTKDNIAELESLKSAGTITLTQEGELETLKQENDELERRIEIQQQLTDVDKENAVDDTKTAMNTEQTYYDYLKEQYGGGIGGSLKALFVGTGYKYVEKDGKQYAVKASEAWKEENNNNTTKVSQFKALVEQLEEQKQALKDFQTSEDSAKSGSDEFRKKQQELEEQISETTAEISTSQEQLQTWRDSLTDENGVALNADAAKYIDQIDRAFTDYTNIGKSKKEKQASILDTYFNSSTGSVMKDYLQTLAKDGASAEEALKKFREAGMTLRDIDPSMSESAFKRYFEDIIREAAEAENAVSGFDGTFDSLESAAEAANQGANYDSVMSYFSSAKEMYENGLWGVDDFQAMAQFGVDYDIAKKIKDNRGAYKFDSDAYKEAFEASQALLERWYGNEDELTNMQNVLADFKSAGLASYDGNGEWSFINEDGSMKFKTTAEAAEKLHTSVSNVETVMSKLEEHGFEFDGITKSGELLSEYESYLDKLKEAYDSMDEGSEKDRLKTLIDGYDEEYSKFEDDLSGLSEDQVVNIKFEYDLSELESSIADLREQAAADNSNESWAALRVEQQNAIDLIEQRATEKGIDLSSDSGYSTSKNAISNLKTAMKGSTGEDRAKFNEEIAAIQDIEEAFGKYKLDGGELNWDEYLNTNSAKRAFDEILENGNLTVQDLKALFGDSIDLDIDADIKDLDSLNDKLSSLENGGTITFEANVDDIEDTLVTVTKNEDGTITYTADVGGIEQEVSLITDKDGKIRYTAEFDGSSEEWLNNNLDVGETIVYTANVDGVAETIEAYKSEDGEIFYSATLEDGTREALEKTLDASGNTVYIPIEAQDNATPTIDKVNGVKIPGKSVTISAKDNATPAANSAKSAINSVTSKTVTISAVVSSSLYSAANTARNVISRVTGGSGLTGTTHLSGTAYATGTKNNESRLQNIKDSWRTRGSQVALTGEVGRELVVTRDNRWYTVGEHGAEFAPIPAGSVVFNSRQTEELLKNGYTNSRATGSPQLPGLADLQGTAFASGGRLPTSKKSSSSSSSSSSSGSSSSSSGSSSSSSSSSSSDAEENLTDWIEVLLNRTSRITDLAVDAIDRAIGLINKQVKAADSISKVQNEIKVNQQAAQKYLDYANQVGLSDAYKKKVQSGELSIEDITDEDLRDKISKYQEYYENYLDAQDNVLDLEDKLTELAEKRLSIIEDEYDAIVDVNDALKDLSESKMDFNDAYGVARDNSDNYDSINKAIEAQEDTYTQLTAKLSEYQKEVESQLNSGLMKKGSEQYYDAMKNINDFTAKMYDAQKELIEWQDKLTQIKLDTIQGVIDLFERRVSKLDKYASLLDSRDESVPEEVYQEQIDGNNSQILKMYEKRAELLKKQSVFDVNSEEYESYAEDIQKLDESILDLQEDNEDLKDSIYELRIKPLEDAIEKYSDLEDELENFRDILNDDAFLDKEGNITDEGLAQIALLQQSIGTAKQKISDYTTGLQKIKELYDNGVISLEEYNEKSKEYREGIQDSIADIKDYKDSLLDLYQDAMETEVEYLQKVIDKRKEALSAKAEYYEYDKKIKSQTKDVNSIKAQIQALEGVNNLSAQAQLKKLRQELQDAEDELADTKREHAQDMQEQGYDKMSDDLDQMLEDLEYDIAHNADKQLEIITSMLDKVVGQYQTAYSKISSIISSTGWVGSTDFNQNQSQISTSTGAESQKNSAAQSQSDANKNPSSSASGVVTDPIKDNAETNKNITQDVMQKENTDNRKIAELKLNKTSVNIQEGQSTTITYTVRPNDAKDKSLTVSGNTNQSIATASCGNGTVTVIGVTPGSTTITVSASDGGGTSANIKVTVTKKPDPPKPTTPSNNKTSGGDGVPRVGDAITYTGRYYHDSWGTSPAGSLYSGVKNGVVIDRWSATQYGGTSRTTGGLKIHIKSADGKYQDLGWVGLNQISGYKNGVYSSPRNQVAFTDENGKPELIIRKSDGAILRKLNQGDGVIPSDATRRLTMFSKNLDNNGNLSATNSADLTQIIPTGISDANLSSQMADIAKNIVGQNNDSIGNVTISYGSLLNVEGNVDKNALPDLQTILEKSYKYNVQQTTKEARKYGLRASR